MSIVAKMLWVLESRSREPLGLDELADVTGLSKSYLSRVFPLVTGYSVTAYLRARRLSEAARQLAQGAPDILSVALEAGYGSHEAFTRAFRDQFGMTPQAVRQRRNLDGISLVEPQRMDRQAQVTLEPPRFETRPIMYFAGISERHRMDNPAGLPGQWQRFQPYIGHIDGAIAGAAYGIIGDMSDDHFEYVVAVEMRAGAETPADLEQISAPALKWARFAHKGDLSTLRATIGAAEGWLTRNGYEASEADYSFIEYYGPGFDARTGSGDIEIWFGLQS
ncbi:helix-turn-helix domain-containing protein [Devosia sp. SD17-2]|jgi:AraC family transcriptional regulator|uniref:AraC family transcriptional regulator n=1 Tax=Devosia sp. SD17-2 TaxID=2976459 RepID=UPI0023D8AB0A|nr:helix-turn-helix domain-containing protein [Devosia sp. SD17-2]WEJ34922.1 AraC family transcriptional regulator [Devosia sp. SD17-2]